MMRTDLVYPKDDEMPDPAPPAKKESAHMKVCKCCGHLFLWTLTGVLSSGFDMIVVDKDSSRLWQRLGLGAGLSIVGGFITTAIVSCVSSRTSNCWTAASTGASLTTRIVRIVLKALVYRGIAVGGLVSSFADDIPELESTNKMVVEIFAGIVCGGFLAFVTETIEEKCCPSTPANTEPPYDHIKSSETPA